MDSEKRRPSCRDQFDRQSDFAPERDGWIERLVARLRALLEGVAGKK
jgi:hypothetical protein